MNGTSILVPLDGSRFSEYALQEALGMARILDATVEIVSVVPDLQLIAVGDPTVASIPPSVLEEEKWRLEKYLKEVAEALEKVSPVGVTTRVLQGDIAQSIEEHVVEVHPILIAMSSHGRGPLSRAWLGSVADQLVRHAEVPVLIVKPVEESEDNQPLFAATDLKKILVPVDGSALSGEGLAWAAKLARLTGAQLALARVVPPPHAYESPYFPGVTGAVPVLPGGMMEDAAHSALDAMKKDLESDGLSVATYVVSGAQAAGGLLSCAEETGADLIVVATHGRGGLVRAALGSVADKIVRGAHVPVLVIRGAKEVP